MRDARLDLSSRKLKLQSLNPNKACGAGEIGSKLLQMVSPGIYQSLIFLFNSSLRSGKVPEEWKAANITQVPKGGNNDDVTNYRPMSILPVVHDKGIWFTINLTDTYRNIRCGTQSNLISGLAIQLKTHLLAW